MICARLKAVNSLKRKWWPTVCTQNMATARKNALMVNEFKYRQLIKGLC